jgi:hypothetical protein
MPLDIRPVAAPTLNNLAATATLKGILLTWDALLDATLFAIEVWAGTTNDRNAASTTLLATVTTNYYLHTGLPSPSTRYYWIRARNIHGRTDGAWTPSSATAGVSATTLLTQTPDVQQYAINSITFLLEDASLAQNVYDTPEIAVDITYQGTGNSFLIDAQNVWRPSSFTVGSSGHARVDQELHVTEHEVYSAGTVSVTNGSPIVTGNGTSWATNLASGDTFALLAGGPRCEIDSVDSNTQITLVSNYTGSTASGQAYYVIIYTNVEFARVPIECGRWELSGGLLLSHSHPFHYRLPLSSVLGNIYDAAVEWEIVRSHGSWALTTVSTMRTMILQEVKR